MLIILETSRKERLIQECYTALANSLTMEHLLDWGLSEVNPTVVSRRMVDWAVEDDVTVRTAWRQHADNSGDEPSGVAASCEAGNPAAS